MLIIDENNKKDISFSNGVDVLSLFDGMACGMLAMRGTGLKVNNYYAYEIDKYAIKTVLHNFPEVQELGDVFDEDFSKYENIDFLMGGSPCTYWSIAQSPDKRETTASGLGWELFRQYVRAVKEAKPKYFIYENNKSMAKAIYVSISEMFGFEPIMINSALVSAQNRQRYYWVGKRNEDGTYSKVDIEQPEDRGTLLKDVLDGVVEPVNVTVDGKAQCLRATCYKDGIRNMVGNTVDRKTCVAEPVGCVQVGAMPRPNGELSKSQGFRIYDINAKSVTLKGDSGGTGGKTGLYAIPVEWDGDEPTQAASTSDGKTYKVYKVENGMICYKDKPYPIKLADGYYIICKLTVSECKRLQTVPEWYEFPVSDTQAYKMLGNGWTVEVIAHLIRRCKG